MNDFSELETELKKLRPAPVSEELRARIEVALLQPNMPTAGLLPRRSGRTSLWWSLGLGLTAASALVLVWLAFSPSRRGQPLSRKMQGIRER